MMHAAVVAGIMAVRYKRAAAAAAATESNKGTDATANVLSRCIYR